MSFTDFSSSFWGDRWRRVTAVCPIAEIFAPIKHDHLMLVIKRFPLIISSKKDVAPDFFALFPYLANDIALVAFVPSVCVPFMIIDTRPLSLANIKHPIIGAGQSVDIEPGVW